MPMTRRARFTLIAAATVVAVPALALVFLLNYDWNHARPWLNDKTSAALERPFAIRGALSLSWQRQPGVPAGWRERLPWPHLVARDVHLGNPAALPSGDMAVARQLEFSLNPFALLQREISIPQLSFDTPQVLLLRMPDGHNNWTFARKPQRSPWRVDLQRVVFSKASVELSDKLQRIEATAQLDTIDNDAPYGVQWKLSGHWKEQAISGHGKTGAVLALQDNTLPFPLLADARVGLVSVAARGNLTNPVHLAALDLQLKVAGASMARLYPLTGLLLPETPPFTTQGRLQGQLLPGKSHWTYGGFTGRVGDSDIAGDLSFAQRQPRGHLTGQLRSKLLQFSDLGPLIGADSNASKQARGVAPQQPAGKVLPVERFHTERWDALDADVTFRAARIVGVNQLPFSNLETELHLQDKVLRLTPLNFDFAGGRLTSTVSLDGTGRRLPDTIATELTVSGRHIKLKELFPKLPQMQATIGEINADVRLTAAGNSVATMLAASNGEMKTVINDGTISKLLLEQMGLNLGNIALTKLVGDKPVKLNCLAGDFAVTDGLARTRSFIVDTEDSTLRINGTVNLASEQLDLTLKPDSKGLRIISLRSPIYVRGTFQDPDVAIDKGVLALRAGGAVALAALAAPAAALAPLISAGGRGTLGCDALLAAARTAPVAPPPGKRLPQPKTKQ